AYERFPDKDLRAELVRSIKAEFDKCYDEKLEEREENGGYDPMTGRSVKEPKLEKVTNHTVSNVLSALQSTELVPSHVEQPAWLHSPGDPPFPADELLLCRNALVH